MGASIATRTGDDGTTALMFNRRLAKHAPRVEAYGTVDELNAALGVARAGVSDAGLCEWLAGVQRRLVALMGELAVLPEDHGRYVDKGFPVVTAEDVAMVDAKVAGLETGDGLTFDGWATPGATPAAAGFDMARTVCRRAERRVSSLFVSDPGNPEILRFLNRLSDCLWLLARGHE